MAGIRIVLVNHSELLSLVTGGVACKTELSPGFFPRRVAQVKFCKVAGGRRVGHQGRLRPVFDGAMGTPLRAAPTINLSARRAVDVGTGAQWRCAIDRAIRRPLPILQK